MIEGPYKVLVHVGVFGHDLLQLLVEDGPVAHDGVPGPGGSGSGQSPCPFTLFAGDDGGIRGHNFVDL